MTEKMHRKAFRKAARKNRTPLGKAVTITAALGAPAATLATFFSSPATSMANSPPAPPPPPSPVVVNGSQWFDWNTDMNPPVVTGYQNSPRLTDSNAGAVNTFLTSLSSTTIHAVKVEGNLSTSTANLIFNNPNYNVSYVFGDIETGLNAPADLTSLVNQVRWVNGLTNGTKQTTGTKSKSTLAYVGGAGFSTVGNMDQTEPGNYQTTSNKQKHSFNGYHYPTYITTGATMSEETLFPGDSSYRNYASGDSTATSNSPPNIRTGLFVLPLWREGVASDSIIKNGLSGIHQHVPYLSNFGNYANLGLDNDRNGGTGYHFIPGQQMVASGTYPFVPASKTSNQMLSDRDFATLVAHIRLRGADSYMTLVSGIQGVTDTQMQQQAKEGWTESHIAARMAASDKKILIGNEQLYYVPSNGNANAYANTNVQVVNGSSVSLLNDEQAGALFSGVYSLTQGKLDILLSNMDDAGKTIRLPGTIGGYALNTKDFTMTGGSHLLIEYTLGGSGKTKSWSSYVTNVPFTDLDLTTGRNRPGVPEPGMISLMGVAAMYGMTRRRRQRSEVL